jgi:hypothetical protein
MQNLPRLDYHGFTGKAVIISPYYTFFVQTFFVETAVKARLQSIERT